MEYILVGLSLFPWLIFTDRSAASLQLVFSKLGLAALALAGVLLVGAGSSAVTSSFEVVRPSLERSARDVERSLLASTWPAVITVAGLVTTVMGGL